jgi:hypothetical protein
LEFIHEYNAFTLPVYKVVERLQARQATARNNYFGMLCNKGVSWPAMPTEAKSHVYEQVMDVYAAINCKSAAMGEGAVVINCKGRFSAP